MKANEIRNEREFYEAVSDYQSKAWQWGACIDDSVDTVRTPEELLELLEERIRWVKAHQKAVERYFQRQGGQRWLRVIAGSNSKSNDQPCE